MPDKVSIKNKTLGEGRPLLCVPIMAKERDGIVSEAERLVELGAEMIEWRVDAFTGAGSLNAIREVLSTLAELTKNTILIYTFRTKSQGGLLELAPEKVRDIRQVAAESRVADLIDVEVIDERRAQREIRQIQKMGARVIGSHHDFHQTPERGIIRMIMEQIITSGADVVKLALMPQNVQDVLNLLEETHIFHESYPDKPLITMSMGELGMMTRLAGECFGSCVTFGAGEVASAPGQIPFAELSQVLDIIHKYGNR
ncbi:MAG: type I 3-dehydroquinate dehydratase [Clostridiales bacterium]|nr:type I 3-dehydroquinate dehydratase [Clostridiales bacterium]